MYQVLAFLDCDYPAFPLSFLRLVLNNAPNDTPADCVSFCGGIVEIIGIAISGDCDMSKLRSMQSLDERSNAMLGTFLAMSFSNNITPARPDKLQQDLTQVLSRWRPLDSEKPSTMEYLAATSLWNRSQLASLARPPLGATSDPTVMTGFLLSRKRMYEEAANIMDNTIQDVAKQHGTASTQYGISVAELANCLNVLRQEARAEKLVRETLVSRHTHSHQDQQVRIYLQFCLIDSLIGRAKYVEAALMLENMLDNPAASNAHRMMSVLRLSKTQRRLGELPLKAFEPGRPLSLGAEILGTTRGSLKEQFIEEMACSLSILPPTDLKNQTNPKRLIQCVNNVLDHSTITNHAPAFVWYTSIQKEYLRHAENTTETALKSGQSGIQQSSKPTRNKPEESIPDSADLISDPCNNPNPRFTVPTIDNSGLPLRDRCDISNFQGPWADKTIISFGAGINSLIFLWNPLTRFFR